MYKKKQPKKNRSKCWFRIFLVILAVLIVVGAVTVGLYVGLTLNENHENAEGNQGAASSSSSAPPTFPSDSALQFDGTLQTGEHANNDENNNHNDSGSADEDPAILQGILAARSAKVSEPGSPQFKAFQWMFQNSIDDPNDDSFFWEYFALVTLYFATNGNDSWMRKDNWLNPDISLCRWYPGTQCDRSGTVTLQNQGLSSEEENRKILMLDLRSNQLNGTLPDEIALLSTLQVLTLDDNSLLVGSLSSSIGSLISLQEFSAPRVGFTGSFPSSLSQLTQLQTFNMQGTSGMNGAQLPTELWNLPQLKILNLEDMGITGSIPTATVSHTELYLKDNRLSGPLPSLSDGDWSLLKVLDLRNNDFTGSIPSGLSNLWGQNLLELRLEGNAFVGDGSICNGFDENVFNSDQNRVLSSDCGSSMECDCCTLCCTQGSDCVAPDGHD